MVKTHLPAHMDSMREKLRPKHQLLILKCYPRLPKNSAADVKPNGSELSYLLYYASTRKSKLQKVGIFLERKTASDVYRSQSARVLVTLQILTALLENKSVGVGSGFVLIAPYVLRIIRDILTSTNDISLIEATLDTWEVFCQHQDQATLKADHEYRELYEDVVSRYANLAHKERSKKLGKSSQPVAIQDAIRLREAGLAAIKSVLLSDALASESGRQLDVVVPAILSNLQADNEYYLMHIMRLSKKSEDEEKEKVLNRRTSIAGTRSYTGLTEGSMDADPRQAEGTVQDADEYAEEEVAILAMDSMRLVFSNENRPQVRSATSAVLKYLADMQNRSVTQRADKQAPESSVSTWATKLFEICTAWTPVQDRFVLMVTTVETLVRLPLKEADLPQQILFTTLVNHILRSDLNLIGLSVMDILLGLVQQVLRVLQLNGPRVAGRRSATQIFSSDEDLKHPQSQQSDRPISEPPSEARTRLIEQLKHCIADLATHVYYTDQVADMLSAILFRLKPNPQATGMQNPIITAAAIEEPRAAVNEVASNISLPARERPSTSASGFFSFDTARQIALELVRDILIISNSSQVRSSGGVAESRNSVPLSIWEGTQWLLRDPAPGVRKAYVDALTTWLKLETKKSDMRIKGPKDKAKKKESAVARRAASNASKKKEQSKKTTSTFLQLLHLAVFENALQFAADDVEDAEREFLILHYLLATLVERLGVNAVQSGLPMVFALQDESAQHESGLAKVRIGSLVHGYFWVLSEVYDFDASSVGQEIFTEIRTRKSAGIWPDSIGVPPMSLDQISSASASKTGTDTDTIKTFDKRQELVDCIADSYAAAVTSPSPSMPASPGRSPGQRRLSAAVPALDRTPSSYLSVKSPINSTLPDKAKAAMLETWTRDSCLAAIAAIAPKSASVSNSQASPSQALLAGNHRQLLAATNTGPVSRNPSPLPGGQQYGVGQVAQPRQQNFGRRLNSESPGRRRSYSASGRASSSGAVHGRVRVDDLKRVLAGGGFTAGLVGRVSDAREDTASESLVDVGGEDLESENGGFVTPPSRMESAADVAALARNEPIPENGVLKEGEFGAMEEPPALSLSSGAVMNGQLPSSSSAERRPLIPASYQKPPPSRGGASVRSKAARATRKDMVALLAGIGSEESNSVEERKFVGIGRPPY